MRATLACILLLGSTACGPSYRLVVGLNEFGAGLPWSYRAGDTVSVYATEWEQRPYETEEPSRSSGRQPGEFTWKSSNPAVIEVIQPGRLVMRKAGSATLEVRSPHAGFSARLVVFSTGSAIRILPQDTSVSVGATVIMQVAALDPAGIEIARLAYNEFSVMPMSPPNLEPNSVSIQPPSSIRTVARSAGTHSIMVSATIHRGQPLYNVTTVVVR